MRWYWYPVIMVVVGIVVSAVLPLLMPNRFPSSPVPPDYHDAKD